LKRTYPSESYTTRFYNRCVIQFNKNDFKFQMEPIGRLKMLCFNTIS